MKSSNLARFCLKFSSDSVHDRYMSLKVSVNGIEVLPITICDKSKTVEFDFALPCEIQIDVTGKGRFDTKIDENGQIIKDTYIKLEWFSIDRMPVKKWYLESKFLQFFTDNQTLTSNYFGHNGTAIIKIDHSDSLAYLLSLQES